MLPDTERPRSDTHLDNRIARVVSAMFHPVVIAIPILILILRDVPARDALGWILLVSLFAVIPVVAIVRYSERKQRFTYQRMSRGLIYGVFFVTITLGFLALVALNAPRPLQTALLSAVIWTPLQYAVNHFWTKISAHSAIITMAMLGLYLMDLLNTPFLKLIALLIVIAVGWARYTSKNHTPLQIVLGWIVAALSVGQAA